MIQIMSIDELKQEGYEYDESDRAFIAAAIEIGVLFFAHDCVVTTSSIPGDRIEPIRDLIWKGAKR